jgi:hypothetical protein
MCVFLLPPPIRYPRLHMCIYISICASADSFYFSYSLTHPATRAHTAVNVPGVTSRYHGTVHEISKVTQNKRRLRHIHVKKRHGLLPYNQNLILVCLV